MTGKLINNQQKRCRVERRYRLTLQEDQHPNQGGKYREEIPAILKYLSNLRQLLTRQPSQIFPRRIGIYLHEQAKEIQHRGHDRGDSDCDITYVQKARHDKGRGAHYRWHEYATRRGAGFDTSRIFL